MDQSGRGRLVGVILFSVGVILGMFLIGISVYADFESTLFDLAVTSDMRIRPIQCPIFLSEKETGRVTASIQNPADKPGEVRVRAHISKGHLILMRQLEDIIQLAPGDSRKIAWEIYPQDAAFNHLILVKVIVYNTVNESTQKGSCGVVVFDLPGQIKGQYLFLFLFGSALLFLASGAFLWWKYGRSYTGKRLEATRSILGLGSLVMLGMISAASGIWELAAVSFYIGLLMIGVIVPHFMISR